MLHRSPQSFFCFSSKHPLFVLNTCFLFPPFSSYRLSNAVNLLLLPFSAAFSAAAALCSNQFLLSSLALHFTLLFFTLYSFLHLCFSHSDLAPSNFNFASFLSFIFSHVLLPVHGLLSFFDLPKTFFAALLMLPKSYRVLPPDHLCLLKLQTYSSPQCRTYLLLINSICSLLSSNLSLMFFLPSALANFKCILVFTR